MKKGLLYCMGPETDKCADCPGQEDEDGNCWMLHDGFNEQRVADLEGLLERATSLLGSLRRSLTMHSVAMDEMDAILLGWKCMRRVVE